MKSKVNSSQKELAIRDQKIDFIQIQLDEARAALEESNRQHSQMVEAMNASKEQEIKLEPESPNKAERLLKKIDDLN